MYALHCLSLVSWNLRRTGPRDETVAGFENAFKDLGR
jgi:hypothetical protein